VNVQKCTVLAYTPRRPDIYTLASSPMKLVSPSSDTVVIQPVTVRVGLTDKMTPSHHAGTSCSIQRLGGIKCFLFLFAKVCNTFVLILLHYVQYISLNVLILYTWTVKLIPNCDASFTSSELQGLWSSDDGHVTKAWS